MRKFFLLLVCYLVTVCMMAQEQMVVSNDAQFNAIVKGFIGYPASPTGNFLSVQIEKANYSNGVYRNVIRLWYGKGNSDYTNLLYQTFPTEEQALAALHDDNQIGEKRVVIDWDAVKGSSQTISLSGVSFRQENVDWAIVNKSETSNLKTADRKNQSHETELYLSFEGLTLNNNNGLLEGIDAKTGLNTNFYSRDRRIITIRGTTGKAWVELCEAPKRKGKVAHFKAVSPNDHDIYGDKVRITGNINQLKAVELVSSVDIFVPYSWKALTKTDKSISWLTVQEYWCASAGIPVEGEPQFRMTLGILKKAGKNNRLYFDLKVQDLETTHQPDGSWKEKYTDLYELDDRERKKFEIPFGKWFNLRTEIVAGDKQCGHFRLVATDYKGRETVIFDEVCQTVATGYSIPGAKRPLYKDVSPLKLYTSANTLRLMKDKPLEIYYDNWHFKAVCVE